MEMPVKVKEFFSKGRLELWINGKQTMPVAKRYLQKYDPGTGELIVNFASGEPIDIAIAVEAAKKSFDAGQWNGMAIKERAVVLEKFAGIISKNLNELAYITSLEVGKPISQAKGEAENLLESIGYYVGLLSKFEEVKAFRLAGFKDASDHYLPRGIEGIILPWNFPVLLFGWNVIPSLAAGNSVIVKCAEDTPLATIYLAKLASGAGIPDGVLNVVTGYGQTAGEALALSNDVDGIFFTGSPEAAARLGKICMNSQKFKRFAAEAGGKGVAVVFPDSDLEYVSENWVNAIRLNSGQVCCDPTRFFIHESIYDRLSAMVVEKLGETRIGYGLDDPEMGPLISEIQVRRVLGMCEQGIKEGANYLLKGGRAKIPGHENGFYVKPALLAGSNENVCCREEIFGPVGFVRKWSDIKQLIAEVNQSSYGLSNVVYCGPESKKSAESIGLDLKAANLWIGAANQFPFGCNYGGCGRSGTGDGVNSVKCLKGHCRATSVVHAGQKK